MNTENNNVYIPDEKIQKALDELKAQGFELGRVYSNPYARAFIPTPEEESPVIKKLKESNN